MGPAVLHGEELRVETGQLADIAILDRTRFCVARDLAPAVAGARFTPGRERDAGRPQLAACMVERASLVWINVQAQIVPSAAMIAAAR
jgi:hypothetical protein